MYEIFNTEHGLSYKDKGRAPYYARKSLPLATAGLMMIAYRASSARYYVGSARGQKILNRTSGSVMIGAGAYLVSSGS
jgi:hypothetical protein